MATTVETLERLHAAYMERHPEAQNPLDYLVGLGHSGLIEALEGADGRRIVFEDDASGDDLVAYHYEP